VLVNGVYVKRCVWSPGGQADALWLWFAPDGFGHAQDGVRKRALARRAWPI